MEPCSLAVKAYFLVVLAALRMQIMKKTKAVVEGIAGKKIEEVQQLKQWHTCIRSESNCCAECGNIVCHSPNV